MDLTDLPSLAVESPTTSIVVETVTTIAFLQGLISANLEDLQLADLERLVELGEEARRELSARQARL